LKLLNGNPIGVVVRFVEADTFEIGRRRGQRRSADKAAGFIGRTGGRHYSRRPKDYGEKVVAFSGFDFGFRFYFLHTAGHLISRAI